MSAYYEPDTDYADVDIEPAPRRWQHWCRECMGVVTGGSPCAPREPDELEEEEEDAEES